LAQIWKIKERDKKLLILGRDLKTEKLRETHTTKSFQFILTRSEPKKLDADSVTHFPKRAMLNQKKTWTVYACTGELSHSRKQT
jgi:hypothetical protein